jgi:D-glycero-D-manno-heptose 1,7-bisphosphate phosphatase
MARTGSEAAVAIGALFLDRDGVINVDRGYVHRPDQFEFLPGIFELARFWTNELRGSIVVVTNQSGIGRGYFDEGAYVDLTRWMCARFEAERSMIAANYHCPYHPVHGVGAYCRDHPWRKPNPGMILQAATDRGLDLETSVLVGDKMSDIQAGAAAGVGLRILLGTPAHAQDPPSCELAPDLGAVLALLRSRFTKGGLASSPG